MIRRRAMFAALPFGRGTPLVGVACLLSLLAGARPAAVCADDIDLTTVPSREGVQLTIYNAEDLTLVRETRRLTFRKGPNRLQFAWSSAIDASSVDLRFREHDDALRLVDTTFPHERPSMLYWTVDSDRDLDALVEISYFMSGMSWAADFVATTNPGETRMDLEGHVRITNRSGIPFAGAEVRMVVGTINLVELVADLARRGIVEASEVDEMRRSGYWAGRVQTRTAVADALASGSAPMGGGGGAFGGGGPGGGPPEIVTEGLSEYFIYTIDQPLDVDGQADRRFALFAAHDVELRTEYRRWPDEYGTSFDDGGLRRFLLVRNDAEHELGTTPLPDGTVRVFRRTADGGLAFIGQDDLDYVPIGQDIEIDLGVDREVEFAIVPERSWRDGFWFRRIGTNDLFSPGRGDRIEPAYEVAGWLEHRRETIRIRNWRDRSIEADVRLDFAGDVTLRPERPMDLRDRDTAHLRLAVPAGATARSTHEVVRRQGTLAEQDRVIIEE